MFYSTKWNLKRAWNEQIIKKHSQNVFCRFASFSSFVYLYLLFFSFSIVINIGRVFCLVALKHGEWLSENTWRKTQAFIFFFCWHEKESEYDKKGGMNVNHSKEDYKWYIMGLIWTDLRWDEKYWSFVIVLHITTHFAYVINLPVPR